MVEQWTERAKQRSRYMEESREITLTMDSGPALKVSTFREAMTDVHCRDRVVNKAALRMECDDVRVSLDAPQYSDESLSIHVFPGSSAVAQEVFVKLESWAKGNRPNWKRRLLGVSATWAWFGFFLASLFSVRFLETVVVTENASKREAKELLAKGVKPETQGRAIELLLAIETGAMPEVTRVIMPARGYAFLGGGLMVALLWSIVPVKTTFEIGRGERSVRWQKWWTQVLTYSAPVFIASVLLMMLRTAIADLIKGWFVSG